ncbi:hypothetical protein [Mucilaginibacter aquatilis]|uniref:Uncharacterized protein n=1 Tax=Mucilaginibacter aquatilis TaxID=1517760 RepID=A0A6I4I5Z8_9SPHI|nr:hypothetical protein [Mucilaginibacter aquatilis]MVN90492.1 hypothetical protein [Mucilaginibacter aquatilis]
MISPKPDDFKLILCVFREGLVRQLVLLEDVRSWADQIILNTEEPDYFFKELSLANTENEVIQLLNVYVREFENAICTRVLLALLYQKLVANNFQFLNEIALQQLGSLNIYRLLSPFEIDRIVELEYYDVYYGNDITQLQVDMIDFLTNYEALNLNNFEEWNQINNQIEAVFNTKQDEQELINASFAKAWDAQKRKTRNKKRLKISFILMSYLAFVIVVAVMLNAYLANGSSFLIGFIVSTIAILRNIIDGLDD